MKTILAQIVDFNRQVAKEEFRDICGPMLKAVSEIFKVDKYLVEKEFADFADASSNDELRVAACCFREAEFTSMVLGGKVLHLLPMVHAMVMPHLTEKVHSP